VDEEVVDDPSEWTVSMFFRSFKPRHFVRTGSVLVTLLGGAFWAGTFVTKASSNVEAPSSEFQYFVPEGKPSIVFSSDIELSAKAVAVPDSAMILVSYADKKKSCKAKRGERFDITHKGIRYIFEIIGVDTKYRAIEVYGKRLSE